MVKMIICLLLQQQYETFGEYLYICAGYVII